jgi:hypothetical protein
MHSLHFARTMCTPTRRPAAAEPWPAVRSGCARRSDCSAAGVRIGGRGSRACRPSASNRPVVRGTSGLIGCPRRPRRAHAGWVGGSAARRRRPPSVTGHTRPPHPRLTQAGRRASVSAAPPVAIAPGVTRPKRGAGVACGDPGETRDSHGRAPLHIPAGPLSSLTRLTFPSRWR